MPESSVKSTFIELLQDPGELLLFRFRPPVNVEQCPAPQRVGFDISARMDRIKEHDGIDVGVTGSRRHLTSASEGMDSLDDEVRVLWLCLDQNGRIG